MIPAVSLIALPVLSVAIVLTFFRLAAGPSLADRVVALDLLTLLAAAITVVTALAWDEPRLFDIAVVLSLIAFLGTVAFARFLEKGVQ